jgi:hypothetical protein
MLNMLRATYDVRADLPSGNSVHSDHDGDLLGEEDEVRGDEGTMAIGD